MSNNPVVIIGGGFAGVYTTKELLKLGVPVLLISETNHFTFTPLLHEVATGSLISHDVIFEYESFFPQDGFEFVRGWCDGIDRANKTISVGSRTIAYSQLVIATGATTNPWKIEGVEHALVLKNVEDAVKLKRAMLSSIQDGDHHTCVSVIGGGPTGLELIFDIAQMLGDLKKKNHEIDYTIRMIHSRDTFCQTEQESVQTYIRQALDKAGIEVVCGAYAQAITETQVVTSVGTFDSNVTVLSAGVRPNTDMFKGDLELDERGHVLVNEHLQTLQDPSIFAVGDVASFDGTPIPKLAQIAVREAPVAAQNIAIIHRGTGEPMQVYTPKTLGILFSLGFGDGVGVIQSRIFKGVLAWYLWRTVYLFKTPGLGNKLRVAFSWTLGLFQGRNLTEL